MRRFSTSLQRRHMLGSVISKHCPRTGCFRTAFRACTSGQHSVFRSAALGGMIVADRSVAQAATPNNPSATAPSDGETPNACEYCVVNFYHLNDIVHPEQVVEQHRAYLSNTSIKGRIYISSQGINAQYGGEKGQATGYAEWVAQQPPFQGLKWSEWPANGQMFPKLRLKHKPNLISLRGGMAALPVTDPTQRATKVPPSEWKRMLADAQAISQGEAQTAATVKPVVLDVRNDYEWDAGHFEGAARPAEEEFAETPVGEAHDDVPVHLKSVDKDAPIMMYCTGGIRCDVYSTFLRKQGFHNLYTLEGGVQKYLREEGDDFWRGSLFVFDGRMAMQPAGAGDLPDAAAEDCGAALQAAVPCQLCGAPSSELPHMNCANIDCNELFIACKACKDRWRGCCCDSCMRAPRLVRPVKIEGGQYGGWGNYADPDLHSAVMSLGRTSEGRLARRQRRREATKVKRQARIEERNAKRQLLKEVRDRMEHQAAAEESGEDEEEGAAASAEGATTQLQRLMLHQEQRAEAGAASSASGVAVAER